MRSFHSPLEKLEGLTILESIEFRPRLRSCLANDTPQAQYDRTAQCLFESEARLGRKLLAVTKARAD